MGDSAAHQVLIVRPPSFSISHLIPPFSYHLCTDLRYQAGSIAAFTVDLLVYPLDTIKTRIQSRDYQDVYASQKPNSAIKGTLGVQPPKPALFRGLYQGIGSVIFATLPAGEFSLYPFHSPYHTFPDR